MITVYFGAEKFDKVFKKMRSGRIKQAMDDLEAPKKDCQIFHEVMQKFPIKEENQFFMYDPSSKEMNKLMMDLYKRFRKNKDTNYVLIFVVAGHGMNADGMQVLPLNEFDPNSNWYKMWNLERFIRTFAENCPNTHTMAFCACCREIYDKDSHWGFSTKEDAERFYN